MDEEKLWNAERVFVQWMALSLVLFTVSLHSRRFLHLELPDRTGMLAWDPFWIFELLSFTFGVLAVVNYVQRTGFVDGANGLESIVRILLIGLSVVLLCNTAYLSRCRRANAHMDK
jgi:hypothetical protein